MSTYTRIRNIGSTIAMLVMVCSAIIAVQWHDRAIETIRLNSDVMTRFILACQDADTGLIEICPKTGDIKFADDTACKVLGYKTGSLKGMNLSAVMPDWSNAVGGEALRMAMEVAKHDSSKPKMAVAKCSAVSQDGMMVEVVTRFYLSPKENDLFANITMSKDILWQEFPTKPQWAP